MYNRGMDAWVYELRKELVNAEAAREAGNEGRARVCARRAAGIAAREYLARRGERPNGSAYDLLLRLGQLAELEASTRRSAELLTLRVSESFELPEGVDLIAEARGLSLDLYPDIKI